MAEKVSKPDTGAKANVANGLEKKVNGVLDQIRVHLEADGGNIDLVEAKEGVVKVKLTGACGCCPMSTMTLKNVIERILKEQLPEVKEVVAV